MHTVRVELSDRSYGISIEAGILDSAGSRIIETVGAARIAVITNPKIESLYGRRLQRSLRRAGLETEKLIVGDGERFKSLRTAEAIYTFLLEKRFERKDAILAFGGGVVGDLAGFAAGTYLRGIRVVHVPTTLLAQIDSSIGGKTGVNHRLGKNLIGVFHQPSLVLIDPLTLKTLPRRQFGSGLYEAIKYGVIRDRSLFERIVGRLDRLKQVEPEAIEDLVENCCRIKAEVVTADEREGGLRRVLNFGHTVGHAIEALTSYRRFEHGEAVGWGMRAAGRIAEKIGILLSEERQTLDEAVSLVGRLPKAGDLAPDDIMSAMQRDKKMQGGRISFVLPTRIGHVVFRSDVPKRVVVAALKGALSEPSVLRKF